MSNYTFSLRLSARRRRIEILIIKMEPEREREREKEKITCEPQNATKETHCTLYYNIQNATKAVGEKNKIYNIYIVLD